jgi:CubicO group peptidase (beta-lactamase class C family)
MSPTTKQNDGGPPVNAGYGYLWWIARTKTNLAAFFAAGIGGHAIYVVPKLNVAIAVKADKIPGGSQNFINDVILPAEALLSPSTPASRDWRGRTHHPRPEASARRFRPGTVVLRNSCRPCENSARGVADSEIGASFRVL